MVSFRQLSEYIEKAKFSPLMGGAEDSAAINVIKSGKDLRKEDEPQFWDDFITLCSNADGLADLLDVSPEKIRSWPAKIKEMLEKLEKHTAESPKEKEDKEVIPTGDNGAITTNVDPYMGGGNAVQNMA